MSNIIEAGRSLEQVTQGILVLSAQTVSNICQIGKLLTEAKSMVSHGAWEKYLEEKVAYSQSTANNFMRLYQEYGEYGPNLQTFGNLNPSQALALLALPEGKREEFAAAHDVESMSVRELKAQIAAEKERADKAEELNKHLSVQLAHAEDACAGYPQDIEELEHELSQEKARGDALQEQLTVAQEEIGAAHQKAADWQKQARDWQNKNSEDKKVERKLRADVTALETELAAARAQAGKLPQAEMSRLRDEVLKEAQSVVAESHRDELAGRDATIERLRAELQQAQETVEQGDEQKTLISIIQDAVGQVGEKLNVLQGHYLKVKDTNPKLAEAIRNLVSRQILLMHERFDIEPV